MNKETNVQKCYLCNERPAVGIFLGKVCCKECVMSKKIS